MGKDDIWSWFILNFRSKLVTHFVNTNYDNNIEDVLFTFYNNINSNIAIVIMIKYENFIEKTIEDIVDCKEFYIEAIKKTKHYDVENTVKYIEGILK